MSNEDYKKEFQLLKDNLTENLAIYHERVTVLIKLTLFDIQDEGVKFKAIIVKPLNKDHAEQSSLYHSIIAKREIFFSASYQFGANLTIPLLKNKKVGRAYCPFTLWLDPELTRFVKENDDEITKQIANIILWNEDWAFLKKMN